MDTRPDEHSLQELTARLAREEQANAALREKLAKVQTASVGEQALAPVSLSRNQLTEAASNRPQPVPGTPFRSEHPRFFTRRQVLLLVVLVILLIGGTIGTIFGAQALRARLSPAQLAGKITEFALPSGSLPGAIASGPDGNLWFTEVYGNKIGRITPTGTITEFALPTTNSIPTGITAGPDGNLWFTEMDGNKIGRITPTGTITEFALPTINSAYEITAGPDGNLWFTDFNMRYIGRITPTGTITEFTLPRPHNRPNQGNTPKGITAGPDGNLWFTENNGNQIGRITPTGTITEFPVPGIVDEANVISDGITAGPDGNLWFTEDTKNQIGRITPTGTVTNFALPTPHNVPEGTTSGIDNQPKGITAGPDGNLWFTAGNHIGRITPTGTVTEFALPRSNGVSDEITAGPNGTLWFTDTYMSKIGRIT